MRVKGVILFLFTFWSCHKETTVRSIEDLKIAVRGLDDKFRKAEVFNGVEYKCKLITNEQVVLQEITGLNKDLKYVSKRISELKNQINFVFIISDEKGKLVRSMLGSPDLFAGFNAYANSDLKNDFELKVDDSEILNCSLIFLEPSATSKGCIRINLGFEVPESTNHDYTLVFNDNIFNNGPIYFTFNKSIFNSIPKIIV